MNPNSKGKHQEVLDAGYLANYLQISPNAIDSEGESPDMVSNLGGISIGLEVTSGASSEHHRVGQLSKKGLTPFVMNIGGLQDRDERRSNEELIDVTASGTYEDLLESNRLWIERMAAKIMRKTRNLNRSDYRTFDQNWLLIFDRQIWFSYDIETYCYNLQKGIHFGSAVREFDRVFIVGNPFIFAREHGVWAGAIFRSGG
ncbi:hypothetical protein OKA04_02205 [Luteolibacter flavescens]|uniref:Uncharacterized protein n=1 Tax=Luteolibacter flavescens TaxID=1859460 RepID=A0ABT3FJ89_9BACT|nr:hypothetical protein [Luteolibacter flavescens]MCW1883522.1 hypothetical protein [Luteolibacter flavescens]